MTRGEEIEFLASVQYRLDKVEADIGQLRREVACNMEGFSRDAQKRNRAGDAGEKMNEAMRALAAANDIVCDLKRAIKGEVPK